MSWPASFTKSCLVGLTAGLLTLAYEIVKEVVHPPLTVWQSHACTVFFGGLAGFSLSLFLIHLERRKIALRQKQNNFSDMVIRNLPAMACIIDEKGKMRLWNAKTEKLLGYSSRELARINVEDTIAREDRERVGQTTATVFSSGAAETEARLLTKDGRTVPCSLNAVRIVMEGKPCVLGIALDNAERQRAEEQLRQSEAKYRRLVANVPEVVWTIDHNGHVVFVSQTAETLSGYTAEELCGEGKALWLQSIHPEDKERVLKALQLLFTEGKPFDLEYRLRRKDGQWIWAHGRSVSTYRNNGVRYADGLLSDISERKAATEGMQRLAAIVSASNDAITTVTREGIVTSWNAGARDVYGYSAAEALGRHISFVTPPDRNDELSGLLGAVADGRTVTVETQRTRKDGVNIDVSLSVAPIKDNAGNVTGLSGNARDITARKKVDEQLQLQSAALGAAANSIVITDKEGSIVWVNEAFSKITGFPKEEVVGKNPRILHSGNHDKAFYANLWATIIAGKVWSGEITNRRKDGTLYTEEMTITPVRLGSREISHFIAIKQDITERKSLERQLRQAQKMEAVGRLAGGVAHDFNNMLGVITGYCELLSLRSSDDSEVLRHVKEIDAAAKRAAGLTQQLLAFSRKQVLQPRVLDLNEVLRKLNNMLRRLIGDDVELIVRCAASQDLRVRADQNQLEQIVMNLAVNARDAMPDGGKLIIETDSCELDESYALHHNPIRPGVYVRLTVTDTGQGMDQDTLSHLFEPFFTTKEAGKGTGLGLSIVYGIVKQSEGYIWAYSEPGQGTTFKIYLPQRNAALNPVTPQPVVESLRGSETVLLVEDDCGFRKVICEFLSGQGYTVWDADSGPAALALLERNGKRPEALITDIMMPGMSGRELADDLRSRYEALKVLYLSGYTHDGVVQIRALEDGELFLQKPFALTDLGKKLRQILRK